MPGLCRGGSQGTGAARHRGNNTNAVSCDGAARIDTAALYDLLQDVVGDEERAIEDNLADMRVILDEWGEGYVA